MLIFIISIEDKFKLCSETVFFEKTCDTSIKHTFLQAHPCHATNNTAVTGDLIYVYTRNNREVSSAVRASKCMSCLNSIDLLIGIARRMLDEKLLCKPDVRTETHTNFQLVVIPGAIP